MACLLCPKSASDGRRSIAGLCDACLADQGAQEPLFAAGRFDDEAAASRCAACGGSVTTDTADTAARHAFKTRQRTCLRCYLGGYTAQTLL